MQEITDVVSTINTPEEILLFGLHEIASIAPEGHADPTNPCYGVKREFKEYAQRILDVADKARVRLDREGFEKEKNATE